MDDALEPRSLLCSVTRKEGASELRLGTDPRSLSTNPARGLPAEGSEFRTPPWRAERRPKARVKWPKRAMKSIRDARGLGSTAHVDPGQHTDACPRY